MKYIKRYYECHVGDFNNYFLEKKITIQDFYDESLFILDMYLQTQTDLYRHKKYLTILKWNS